MEIRHDPVYQDAKSSTSFQDGLEFQDFVCTTLAKHGIVLQNLSSKRYQYDVGENLQGFEIKCDNRCTDTNRLSIEVAEKTSIDVAHWTPSGIFRNDNSWLYIQGNRKILFVFAKTLLVAWHDKRKPQIVENRPTIRSFFLDFNRARKMAARVLEFV